jgi:hypothetical protein
MSPSASTVESFLADAPQPGHERDLELFGRFVGRWDFEWKHWEADGTVGAATGQWIFAWALGGHAMQDVWIVPAGQLGLAQGDYGTTIRYPNPGGESWQVIWASPVHGYFKCFTARPVGDEIVLETTDEGFIEHWVFSEITSDSFRWRAEKSSDGGSTWQMDVEMRVRRQREV